MDEIAYEGNIQFGWGNISGREMVRRFWEAALRGGYPGHGETYRNEEDILKQIPGHGLMPYHCDWDEVCAVPQEISGAVKNYYLIYYSFMRPSFRELYFDDVSMWKVSVIDTWNMTIEERGVFSGKFRIDLPGREYMAVRVEKQI